MIRDLIKAVRFVTLVLEKILELCFSLVLLNRHILYPFLCSRDRKAKQSRHFKVSRTGDTNCHRSQAEAT